MEEIDIISNINRAEIGRVSFAEFVGDATYWFQDAEYVLSKVDDVRIKSLKDSDEPEEIGAKLTSRKELLENMAEAGVVLLRNTLTERPASQTILFHTSPQNSFNKNFEVLADELLARHEAGYRTFLMSENRAQAERLEGLLYATGRDGAKF